MSAALAADGLYEREADAMVKTWDDSWFTEEGLRVLYVISGKWTDEVLPLKLSPAPREMARVFVGRAEVITPQVEAALAVEIDRYMSGNDAAKALAIENTRRLNLGHFAEPALSLLFKKEKRDRSYVNASRTLIRTATKSGEKVFGAVGF